ncbi:diacylglycerol/lipid kinase family protein [Mucilaginibacter myungsuensis]|uniref:Diacylglycerol kinase family lipid kinase n=1 Tax=Mucilaginibacter myungsuensis TaxID=649104 RepID=A0A929KYJ4_9SPHI|nr:diacylglycerol kinase family protein [Mucilaginibacter myungsuensis]MBE9661244.1 diacylglycerol kinase family lipid kinase [Mucilaginibacter myungsuensis]MDN3597387.1 diacylglycerol kinase family lipid kinase [Mucilaginibacter myungsuensis]
MKSKVLFIINPISGGKNKDGVPALIKKHLDPAKFEYRIDISTGVLHAQQLAQKNLKQFDIIVAVGGDGTINEIASVIAGTDTTLGVIPYGSGNGLSRFLSIPMDPEEAIKTLSQTRTEKIDAAKLNGKWFFNMAGMGFDAHISEVFSHDKNRGFWAYIKSSFKEVMAYKPATYSIDIDGQQIHREAFMLSFANSSQYGNNAHVSPYASVQDGLFDVCVIKPFPLWKFVYMGLIMFTKTADKSKYVEIIRGKHITVKRDAEGPIHLDGEPMVMGTKIDIEVMPAALNIIVGDSYKA